MKQSDARLLVVDDDAAERRVLVAELKRFGYHNITDLAEADPALEAIAGGGIDLLLLDIDGPGVDANSFLGRLKALPPRNRVPVIVISGKMGADAVARWLQAGADG